MELRNKLFPFLGFGLGLRREHYDYVIKHHPPIDWFEIISENFMIPGGKLLYLLEQIAEVYPMVMHGVSLSIGSFDAIDVDYLKKLKQLSKRINARWISDHLCWIGVHGKNTHDLLPMPYTEEALSHLTNKINQVQDYLEQPLLLENPSTYITFETATFSEPEFLTTLVERTKCLLLLDINNIYVNSVNHQFDALEYINTIPANGVQQFHLSGHCNMGDHIIDTHDEPIIDAVWDLYKAACKRFGQVSSMIERDDNIPPFEELFLEYQFMQSTAENVWKEEKRYA